MRIDVDTNDTFTYEGDASLRTPITEALRRVVDPEMALCILDIGLVHRVSVRPGEVHVLMTMTSAACPATELMAEEVEVRLEQVLPRGTRVNVELCWEPAWTPDRMSDTGKLFMGW